MSGHEVLLRLLSTDEAPDLLDLINQNREQLRKFWWESTMQVTSDAQRFIDAVNQQERTTTLPTRGIWTKRLIGVISLHTHDQEARSAAVGFWIDTNEAGHGYATEATRQLAHYAFESLAIDTLTIATRTSNSASRGVAERTGFRLTGIDSQPTWQSAEGHESTAHYELSKADLVEATS